MYIVTIFCDLSNVKLTNLQSGWKKTHQIHLGGYGLSRGIPEEAFEQSIILIRHIVASSMATSYKNELPSAGDAPSSC